MEEGNNSRRRASSRIISANCHVSAEGKHRGDIQYVGAGG